MYSESELDLKLDQLTAALVRQDENVRRSPRLLVDSSHISFSGKSFQSGRALIVFRLASSLEQSNLS